MQFVHNDGGRAAAGFKGSADDCVCRAIAIATEQPYADVYEALNHYASAIEKPRIYKRGPRRGQLKAKSSARTGVYKTTTRKYLEHIGWTFVPTMAIGSGCKVHLSEGELPMGRLIASVSRHIVAVIDGVIHDTHNPARGGTRCVYGYWQKGTTP